MGKINQLKPNVFNMLAAGEVVERPASVVKELVENSLDAGATHIDVLIENGGIRKIQVSDDGIGILPEDMRSAFLPHATSKISAIDDLDSLATLGFRGEALASIASVSEVSVVSSSKDGSSKIVLSGGSVTYEGVASRERGTTITIENLFFNTPARLKFLKKPQSEGREVLDTVRKLLLANPSISFTLVEDGKTLLSHEGGSLAEAICSVYGAKAIDNLLEVKPSEFGSIKVHGYTSSCDFTKPNRTYQTIVVNGRCVEDDTVQTAVEKAYGDYLMKRTYPMFVIDIVMPFDEVDSNVHPRKIEVRFQDKQKVFSAVYHAVKDAVDKSVLGEPVGLMKEASETPISENRERNTFVSASQIRIDTPSFFGKPMSSPTSFREPSVPARNTSTVENIVPSEVQPNFDFELSVIEDLPSSAQEIKEERVFDGKIIGQAFATYLLVERDEILYVIDQHAAHERLLYDRLVSKFVPEYSQPLLSPYPLNISASEEEYLERIMPSLNSFGFEIEKQDGKYAVLAVPEACSSVGIGRLFGEIFGNIYDTDELQFASLFKDMLCQTACKAAIKGGESLSKEQIERVISNYLDENGNLPAKCPHGRPAVIALSKRDFEKMFKRIV